MSSAQTQKKWRERVKLGLTGRTCEVCGKRLREESKSMCFRCWRKSSEGKAYSQEQTAKASNKYDAIAEAKKISVRFPKELGFVNKAALEKSHLKGELEVIPGVGFCHYHHRKDQQTTIYSLAVLPEFQKQGWGRLLFYRVICSSIDKRNDKGSGKFSIVAKCPQDLESNAFYKSIGFTLKEIEPGRKRLLNVWEYQVNLPLLFYCGAGGRSKHDINAIDAGWRPGLRSTYSATPKIHIAMIDNDWKNYDYQKHLELIQKQKPLIATVQDIESLEQLPLALKQAREIAKYCGRVIVIPKVKCWIPTQYWLGFSIPTSHGGCTIDPGWFGDRPCHLLGGDANDQAKYYKKLSNVISLDHNAAMRLADYGKAMHQYCSDAGEPVAGGCYEALKISMIKQKKYWHHDIWDATTPVQLDLDLL